MSEYADVADYANRRLPEGHPLKGSVGSNDEDLAAMCADVDGRPLTAKYRNAVIESMEDAAAEVPDAAINRRQVEQYFDAVVEGCYSTGHATRYKRPIPTITEGTWTVGVDFPAGTYRSDGDFLWCYWQISRSGTNGADIIANDNIEGGRPTVTLTKGQDFKSQDCGTWKKVG